MSSSDQKPKARYSPERADVVEAARLRWLGYTESNDYKRLDESSLRLGRQVRRAFVEGARTVLEQIKLDKQG